MSKYILSQLLAAALSITSAVAQTTPVPAPGGGTETGNGGDGVCLDEAMDGGIGACSRYYTLDLVEAGMHITPYFNPAVSAHPFLLAKMRSILGSEPRFETAIEPLARKLTEISQAEGILARTIAQAFESTQWRFSPLPLRDIQDEETTLAIPRERLVQLAIRNRRLITLDAAAIRKLDPGNLAALLLHEVSSYLLQPESIPGTGLRAQRSDILHQFIAAVFSPGLTTATLYQMLFAQDRGFDRAPWYLPFSTHSPAHYHRFLVTRDSPLGETAALPEARACLHRRADSASVCVTLRNPSQSIDAPSVAQAIHQFCRSAANSYGGYQNIEVVSAITTSCTTLWHDSYNSPSGQRDYIRFRTVSPAGSGCSSDRLQHSRAYYTPEPAFGPHRTPITEEACRTAVMRRIEQIENYWNNEFFDVWGTR